MKAVKDIVKQLRDQAATEVRALLLRDKTYAEISVKIFDNYRSVDSIESLRSELDLEDKSFNIFERIIYLTILRYFGLEDNSMKDVLSTTVFYALNGNCQKNKEARIKELEDYFHAMKRYEIEEEASSLLSELYLLSQGSQLETVYRHLYLKYKELDSLISKALQLFEKTNLLLDAYLKTDDQELLRSMISNYKELRSLADCNPESKNLNCLYKLCKLNLVVIGKQEQLLKDGNIQIEDLLFSTKNQIDGLAFGIKRFFLQNIHAQIKAHHLMKNNDIEMAIELMDSLPKSAMIEAHNFEFPRIIYKDIRNAIVAQKFYSRNGKLQSPDNYQSKLSGFQQAFSHVVRPDLFGRNPYSHLVN